MRKILALLLCLLSAPAAAYFQPWETPTALSVTSTSSSVHFTNANTTYQSSVQVFNAGNITAYVGCGGSGVIANVPGAGALNATPVGPGVYLLLFKGNSAYCAGITATGSTTLYFTDGQ